MAAEEEDSHLWDRNNPLQQGFVGDQSVLNQKRPELMKKVELNQLWAHLRALGAIDAWEVEDIKRNGTATRTEQMESLLDHLERGQMWRLHAFFRACVRTKQPHIVSLVGLQPEDYTIHKDPPVASTKQDTRRCRPSLGLTCMILAVVVAFLSIGPGVWFIRHNGSSRDEISCNRQNPDGITYQKNNLIENGVTSLSVNHPLQEASITEVASRNKLSAQVSEESKTMVDSGLLQKPRHENVLTTAINTHRQNYKSGIMVGTVFDIDDDDPDAEVMNTTNFYLDVNATLYKKHTKKHGFMVKESELFGPINGDPEPTTIQVSGSPGVGKSTYIRHLAYSWSVGELDLKLVLYVPADLLDGDIWLAIRESIWCEEKLQEAIIEYIQKDGEGVVIAFDGTDEVQNQYAITNLRKFNDKQKYRNWPKIVVSARSGLHSIAAVSFQRSVELHGFTLKQGMQYVSKYGKAVQAKTQVYNNVMNYVHRYADKLVYILSNCLYAHTFSVLAFNGIYNLNEDEHFSTFTLMQSMIKFRLEREYIKRRLDDQQPSVLNDHGRRFNLMCLYIMIIRRRQVETSIDKLLTDELLQKFDIDYQSPYHVFLKRNTSRGLSARKIIQHAFDHEVIYEHFVVYGILETPPALQRLILLFVCSDRFFFNIQKILIEAVTESKTKVSSPFSSTEVSKSSSKIAIVIIRGILLLTKMTSEEDDKEILVEFLHIQEDIITSFFRKDISSILLNYSVNEEVSRKVDAIWSKVNDAFESEIELLRAANWFGLLWIRLSLTNPHIILQDLPTSVKNELYKETINRLLPSVGSMDEIGQRTIYAVGQTRWATVTEPNPLKYHCVQVCAWSPGDAREALEQHYTRYYARTAETSSPKQMVCLGIDVGDSPFGFFSWWGPHEPLSKKAWLECLQQIQQFGRIHKLLIHIRGSISAVLPHIPKYLLDVLHLCYWHHDKTLRCSPYVEEVLV